MKKYLFIGIVLSCYFFNISNIFADHQCEYSLSQDSKNNDFTITYTSDEKVIVDAERWYNNSYVQNFVKSISRLILFDYDDLDRSSSLLSDSVSKALSEESCPGEANEVYICTGLSASFEPTKPVTSLAEFFADLFHPIWTEGVTFSSCFETLGDDLSSILSISNVKNSLIIAGSQRDAQQTYGYFDGKGFDINWDGFYKADEDFDLGFRWGSMDCKKVYYIGDKTTFNMNCPYLANASLNYTNALNGYRDCDENADICKRDNLNIIDESENKLKQYCESIIKNQDYYLTEEDEKNGVVNVCMTECLKLSKTINSLRKDAGLDVNQTGTCGFTDKLLNWIKYIIPAIVIVLGILDFVKAIASEKDDEMKKAQARFIKRLIAAALIFIVPFIIEYILDVFKLIDKTCGMF